ncbi:MAG TPA: 2-oxoglutarate and iron-dependent oxygenase domain-containing protein [Streptosporangiaceae bacterium]|nr:2-oxoglutarate and iron-dependent oxygenase domain-containing protein [Streptosporangiaceae bacterium]
MSNVPAFTQIPVIDVTALREGSPVERAQVISQVGAAASEVGFCHVSSSGTGH